MSKMDGIEYWIKTKRAPCLYKYDMVNNQLGDAHCSKIALSKNTPPSRDINSVPKKKRKLSIFEESESEQCKKNIYFDDTPHVPQATVMSSCKDSIISNTELKDKKTKCKARRLRKRSPKPVTRTTCKRNLRSISKMQGLDSSLESGLFSGDTKNKQSSISKSLSKKSVDKYPENTPIQKEKAANGLFDDISDVSGFTASYIRSTKKDTLRKLSKTKNNMQLIKESQDKSYVSKHVEIARDPLQCSSDSSNIINIVTVNNDQSMLEKDASLLKFLTPTERHTPKRGRPRKKQTPVLNRVSSRYFTRSKASSLEDLSLFNSENASTPMKVCDIERISRASHQRLSANLNDTCDKSGYAACFSDTDSEQPVRKRSFFH